MPDDDEPVTKPDLARFDCPNCKNEHGEPQGEILVTVWDSSTKHTSQATPCTVCWGVKTIDREAMARWKARSGQ